MAANREGLLLTYGPAEALSKYADDMVLLAHSIKALQTLIDICFKFAGENNILYNETSYPLRFVLILNPCSLKLALHRRSGVASKIKISGSKNFHTKYLKLGICFRNIFS